MELLSLKRLCGGASGWGGAPSLGTLEVMLKSPDAGHLSPWGPLHNRGEPGIWGGLCTGDIERWMKEGSFAGEPKNILSKAQKWVPASIGAPLLGNMDGCFFPGAFLLEEFLWGLWEICKMPCRWVSLSIGALLGNLEGGLFAGTFERKEKVYLGSFLGHRGHWGFKSGGHLELLIKEQGSPDFVWDYGAQRARV